MTESETVTVPTHNVHQSYINQLLHKTRSESCGLSRPTAKTRAPAPRIQLQQ